MHHKNLGLHILTTFLQWLLNHRTDFTDNGWGQLCGTENMKYGVMGGHHFSMMKDPHAVELGRLIRTGIDWHM